MRILVTGATGFVGHALLRALLTKPCTLHVTVRSGSPNLPDALNSYVIGDLKPDTDWSEILAGMDVVIHLAARVHVLQDMASDPLAEFRLTNCAATLNLAQQAADAGAKNFIFLSSIGVNGNNNDIPFTENDIPNPIEDYAVSKLEAELGLLEIAKNTNMDIVIIRPPLVYGPNARGNFGSLVNWVKKGLPLPLGSIDNKKSFVALDNLVNFIIHCIDHPAAANQIFLISDGEDVTTTQLLQKVAKAYGCPSRLIPVPVSWMKFAAKLLGKEAVANRLFGSLQVDSSKARDLLGWQPVVTMDEQLAKMKQSETV